MIVNNFVPDISVFNNISSAGSKNVNSSSQTGQTGSFYSVLTDKLNEVNDKQIEANDASENFINGDEDIHTAMIQGEEAKESMELAVQVRNKVLDAYQELEKMQF